MLTLDNPHLKDDQDAIVILWEAIARVRTEIPFGCFNHHRQAEKTLINAIRHIARAEQYWYPKVRGAAKSNPVRGRLDIQ